MRIFSDLLGTRSSAFRIKPAASNGAPLAGAHVLGEIYMDAQGVMRRCIVAGTPGVWEAVPTGAVDATYTYNPDGTLASVTNAYGTKNFTYTDGKLTGVSATNVTKAKTLAYTGEQLTSIDVSG